MNRIVSIVLIVMLGLTLAFPVALPQWGEAAVASEDGNIRTDPDPTPPPPPPPPTGGNKPPVVQPSGPPISIVDAQLRNEDYDGNALSEFKIGFDFDETRYIAYHLKLVNNAGGRLTGPLGIRFYRPDGSLRQGKESPAGFTMIKNIDMFQELKINGGWGSKDGGVFAPGRHRIEFWWAGQKIHQMTFAISEPDAPLQVTDIRLRNETKDSAALSDFGTSYKQNELQYLTFYIDLKNVSSIVQKGQLGIKYIGPGNQLLKNDKSAPGFTLTDNLEIKGDTDTYSNGWGRPSGGSFEPGRYRIEFWWKGKQIGTTAFIVE